MSQIWTADMMSQPSNVQDRKTHLIPMAVSSIPRTCSLPIIEPVVPFHDGKEAVNVSPHATAQSVHRFMRRTIASGKSCHTLMTRIVTKIHSSWFVMVRPADPAASEGRNPSEGNTMNRVSGSKRNSWTIWGEKMKGPWRTEAVMA